ncbi:hypothetical protein O1M54_21645 [Streptomyces diastatochromogenes]|nr:hypothetical protein [Streptomyces diastatochromogenes]
MVQEPGPRPGDTAEHGTPRRGRCRGGASAIFGNPLVGAVILIEVAGVGGPQLFAVMLPALLSSGIGSLVFTGFGHWTGLPTGSLSLKLGVPFPRLDAGDVLWSVVMAAGIAVALHVILSTGRLAAVFVVRRPVVHTVLCALAAGVCAAVYTLAVDRSPADVASSGEAVMAQLAADPHAWGVGALVAVLLCKGAAYALCLGSLRGGPVFPSLFLGAATGVLLAPLPGLGVVPGMAAGMAAAAAARAAAPGQQCGAGRPGAGQRRHDPRDHPRRRGRLRDGRAAAARARRAAGGQAGRPTGRPTRRHLGRQP